MPAGATTRRADLGLALQSCAVTVIDLANRPEVRGAWDDESACTGMSVGGLTHHLLAQIGHVAAGLRASAPSDAPVIGLLDHYARAPWVAASRSGETDPSQDAKDNVGAAIGPEAVVARARQSLAEVPALLGSPRDPDIIHIPWQGWALPTADFVTTRLMEMVVHGDDLAVSVGLATPEHEPAVVAPVVALLAEVSLRRHGQVALVRALSRPQRSTGDISAF